MAFKSTKDCVLTTILIKCQEFARLNYVMGTKTSNRSWKSADVCTFLPLSFFNSLEAMQSCFGAHVEIVVRDGQTVLSGRKTHVLV